MSSEAFKALQADAQDVRFHVFAKSLLGLPLLIYLLAFFVLPHTLTPLENVNNSSILIAHAKDGLKMSVLHDLPEWKLALHSVCAMGLLVLCFFQKQNVVWMAESTKAYLKYASLHRWVGRFVMVLVTGMDVGGLLMGEHSTLDKFQIFVVFFAAPFAVFGIGLYITAKPGFLEYHRLFANMLVKGCIGTPLARLGGSFLQRFESVFTLSTGYYAGIGAVTIVLGMWQVIELGEFLSSQAKKKI